MFSYEKVKNFKKTVVAILFSFMLIRQKRQIGKIKAFIKNI